MDLVVSPRITVLLLHSVYVIIDGKVIKIERLKEAELRAQAVRLLENYSFIASQCVSHHRW